MICHCSGEMRLAEKRAQGCAGDLLVEIGTVGAFPQGVGATLSRGRKCHLGTACLGVSIEWEQRIGIAQVSPR